MRTAASPAPGGRRRRRPSAARRCTSRSIAPGAPSRRSRRTSSSTPRRRARRRRRGRRRVRRAPRRTPCASRPPRRARSAAARAGPVSNTCGSPGSGIAHLEPEIADAAELRDRALRVVERLAVPALVVLDRGHALALQRSREDRRRLAGLRLGLRVRAVDLLDVVAVDLDRVPAERAGPLGEDGRVPADHRLAALAEPVDVDDRGEVVERVVRGVLERLPDRALGHLAVAAEHPHAVGQPVEVLAGDRHPDADRQPLAERAGGDVHPREHAASGAPRARAERPVRRRGPRRRSRRPRGTSP